MIYKIPASGDPLLLAPIQILQLQLPALPARVNFLDYNVVNFIDIADLGRVTIAGFGGEQGAGGHTAGVGGEGSGGVEGESQIAWLFDGDGDINNGFVQRHCSYI